MRKLFYLSVLALIVFEILNVYFIMPFPGSQRINSIDTAYFLYHWRWIFRIGLGLLILFSGAAVSRKSKWHLLALLPLIAVAYFFNFQFSADRMFPEPAQVIMKNAAENTVAPEKLIVGVVRNGEAKAYPIQFIAYHHKVRDTLGGKPALITYCTVCRTGRAFKPLVGDQPTTFRLVGMDRFNAMIEDAATGSWWRQANGEAIEGDLKGQKLPEIDSTQCSLEEWLKIHPDTLIMQPDPKFIAEYEKYVDYENGKGGELTGRNSNSWADKSWVVGIAIGNSSKAFDWNKLKSERIINDEVDGVPIVIALAPDDKSFFAFERPQKDIVFTLQNDRLHSQDSVYELSGKPVSPDGRPLKRLNAYQEFWHSWQTFHPETEK